MRQRVVDCRLKLCRIEIDRGSGTHLPLAARREVGARRLAERDLRDARDQEGCADGAKGSCEHATENTREVHRREAPS